MASKELDEHGSVETVSLDAGVVADCQAGDRRAQQRLYELCHRRVYRLMVRMVGLQEAADLTQQVFLQVFRKIDQFVGHSKFETWLYRVAVNEALQHLRKGRCRKHRCLEQEPMDEAEPATLDNERKDLIEQALARIDVELRTIFILRQVDGLSYREIAETCNIAEGTVGSRLNRARRELQQHLLDLGWEP